MPSRNLFLDVFRCAAIFFMVTFHLAYDLEVFYGFPLGYREGLWFVLNMLAALSFMLVSGWAAGAGLARRHNRRGRKLLLAALAVSAATYIFDPVNYVRFGILHFLAAAAFLAPRLSSLPSWCLLALAAAALPAGETAARLTADGPWLLPLGVRTATFSSMDYYPLLPWLACFITGLLLGRHIGAPAIKENKWLNACGWLGRRSLVIYLAHQPLMLLILNIVLAK